MSDAGNISVERSRDWPRAGFTVVFLFLFACGQALFNATAIVQLIWFLIAKEPNPWLRRFGTSLGLWLAQVARYVFMDSNDKPFPWAVWPSA
jgi:Domain of unknown function (DUF4389)